MKVSVEELDEIFAEDAAKRKVSKPVSFLDGFDDDVPAKAAAPVVTPKAVPVQAVADPVLPGPVSTPVTAGDTGATGLAVEDAEPPMDQKAARRGTIKVSVVYETDIGDMDGASLQNFQSLLAVLGNIAGLEVSTKATDNTKAT